MYTNDDILELESKCCFDFFWNEASIDKNSRGFGLIRDRYPSTPDTASIASVGFGLTAIIIGIERGWITYKEGYERVNGTLNTLLYGIENVNGFFHHFVDFKSGKRAYNSEVSIIDSAIAVCGAITVGEYFKGEIKDKALDIYKRINWEWYRDPVRNMFYMGYTHEKGFTGWWDFYAEQLMLYFLSTASPTHPVDPSMYYSFERNFSLSDEGNKFINSWFGSLFTHQFSHAWFDLRNRVDRAGVNWWNNSVNATLANRTFCMENSKIFKSLNSNSWGLTACDGPLGYNGSYGCAPSSRSNNEHFTDGTVPPCGAAGSMVFTPELSIACLNNLYMNYPRLWGKYGFKDAYNTSISPEWYGEDVIGIDKGITLLMIENFRTSLIWNTFMKNEYVRLGLERVGLDKVLIEDAS